MDVDGGPGKLSSESLDERRARLITPREVGSTAWRRTVVVLALVLAVLIGVWFGAVPGSAWFGRYPVWSLYALADRIDQANASAQTCDTAEKAKVNLVTGRVEVSSAWMNLTPDERAMISGLESEGAAVGEWCDGF